MKQQRAEHRCPAPPAFAISFAAFAIFFAAFAISFAAFAIFFAACAIFFAAFAIFFAACAIFFAACAIAFAAAPQYHRAAIRRPPASCVPAGQAGLLHCHCPVSISRVRRDQLMCCPPLMAMFAPVTNAASSDAR
ncbi:hypothetical protein [Janthinobacterium sp. 551a]|uniref:hypothetical protein n=1 Tax=Janthinobacterium sp. 551a TaxID=1566281 RepID=UPI0011140BAA|nr:hypothetical protein [Janthinobacterium sp. 551a]